MTAWPFHAGELEAQARAGGGSRGGGIRDQMPDQHRAFFEALPFVIVAGIDRRSRIAGGGDPDGSAGGAGGHPRGIDRGMPAAAVWTGAPGFVTAPDPGTLRVAVALDPADPASRAFVPGAPFGLLGIELATRRRNRANGVIAAAGADGVTVAIHQSFGNCPQYIHPRELHRVADPAAPAVELAGLDAGAARAIRRADTLFVATAARTDEPTGGVDVSHRGGPAGFVQVDGDVVTIPDYRGNRYFNTLGNLVSDPRAAVIFVDFARGDLLHVQGTAEIVWDGAEVRALAGAERLWRLRVERAWRRRGGLGLRSIEPAAP